MSFTVVSDMLISGKPDDARQLLQEELLSGRLIDPRIDDIWSRIADGMANGIGEIEGPDEVIRFWEELLHFFTDSLEPRWGHCHKGHIYFRLGFAYFRKDFAKARQNFELAYKDDIALETSKGGTSEEIIKRSYNYSAYVALTILERIDESNFSPTDKERFRDDLFGPSFDAAITGTPVPPDQVASAIATIVPSAALSMCQARYNELQNVTYLALPFATVSLTGTVLESLLVADLYFRRGIKKLPIGKKEKNILDAELGPLLTEAIRNKIFPTPAIRSAFQLIQLFRNRLHPGNELRQQYKLVPRVALTLEILFELALLDWQKAFPKQ